LPVKRRIRVSDIGYTLSERKYTMILIFANLSTAISTAQDRSLSSFARVQ
jgi:hypothetical protein